jgi:hypothetical protein
MGEHSEILASHDREALESLIRHTEGTEGHWIWKGTMRRSESPKTGMPWFRSAGGKWQGSAAKFLWEIKHGVLLGRSPIHRVCDEPQCVNPNHHQHGRDPRTVNKTPRPYPKTRRPRVEDAGDEALVGEVLRLYRKTEDSLARNAKNLERAADSIARIRARLDVLGQLPARLDVIEAELTRLSSSLAALHPRTPLPAIADAPAPATPLGPLPLTSSFEKRFGLRTGAVLDEAPLTEVLDLALASTGDGQMAAAVLFARWLDGYAAALRRGTMPTPKGFLSFVREAHCST